MSIARAHRATEESASPADRAWEIAQAYGRGFPPADQAAVAAHLEVGFAGNELKQVVSRFLSAPPYSIGGPRYSLLRLLFLAPSRRLSHSAIAAQLGTTQGNVTQLVDALVGEGLVKRVPSPESRRTTLVTLTRDGLAKAEQTVPAMIEVMERSCAGLTAEEKVLLKNLLAKFRSGLQAIDSGTQVGFVSVND